MLKKSVALFLLLVEFFNQMFYVMGIFFQEYLLLLCKRVKMHIVLITMQGPANMQELFCCYRHNDRLVSLHSDHIFLGILRLQ